SPGGYRTDTWSTDPEPPRPAPGQVRAPASGVASTMYESSCACRSCCGCTSQAQRGTRLTLVGRDLALQGIQPLKLHLVTQLVQKPDLQVPAVNVFGKIEQVHFQRRCCSAADRRLVPEIRHPRQ